MTRSKLPFANGRNSPAALTKCRSRNCILAIERRVWSMSIPVIWSDAATPQGVKSRPDPQPKSKTRTAYLHMAEDSYSDEFYTWRKFTEKMADEAVRLPDWHRSTMRTQSRF